MCTTSVAYCLVVWCRLDHQANVDQPYGIVQQKCALANNYTAQLQSEKCPQLLSMLKSDLRKPMETL